ncbi:hypothetical protein C8T65DRAFT_233494 [Cerioporus squamosus]|nr:hypothetical protein C8T65DRAFT_233494 [Cerioporus squamosus]
MPDDSPRKHALEDAEKAPVPAKRARGGEPGGQAAGIRRDEEFWYDDGTILLHAGDVEFRVYKGVLATHSPIFADMFSLPQPQSSSASQSSPEPQACPTVSLDDSAEDLRTLFRAILPNQNGTFVHKKRERPSFHQISAYARLGHKYQIDHLVEQAVNYLKEHFTDDFDMWIEHAHYVPRGFYTVHAIGVVNIARLVNCDSILPTALAACCTFNAKTLLRGFKRVNDSSRETLSEDDLLRCLQAKETFMQEASSAILEAFSSLMSPACRSSTCRSGLPPLLRKISADAKILADIHPFRVFQRYYSKWFEGLPVCADCQKRFREHLETEQRLRWTRLPDILGLSIEGWGLPRQVPVPGSNSAS